MAPVVSKRVVLVYNTSQYVWKFRMPLIAALRDGGYEVVVLAPRDGYTSKIEGAGVAYRELAFDGKGRNPLRELATLCAFVRAYRNLRPAAALHYTIKPNLYGSLAARFLGIPVVNNVTGLGAAFESRGFLQSAVKAAYRVVFSKAAMIFFQNRDDMGLFLRCGLVGPGQADLLPGSGVDLKRFAPRARPAGPFSFLFMGRLLKAKGTEDLIAASRIMRKACPGVRVVLLGQRDEADSGAADQRLLEAAHMDGTVELAGETDDVRPFIAAADCVVLPSYYREGVPRSLLEAAAMGKPLIAADSIGTREPVEDGVNGFLCRPRDPEDLAARMIAMVESSPAARSAMGAASRRMAEERYDEALVIGKYLDVIGGLVPDVEGNAGGRR
jgi:glycosyltransferase involved in cell wall biosynthesis